MTAETFTKKMSDGEEVVVHKWLPSGKKIKGVVLISHGMAEHIARYDGFAKALTDAHYAVYGENHRGHGETGELAAKKGTGKLGYLAKKDGFKRVVEDIHEEVLMLRELHPDTKIILFGHSFGSFIAQAYIEDHGDSIDGCVLCGTAGPRIPLMTVARCIGGIVNLFGPMKESKFIDKVAFGSNNAAVKNPRTPVDWLSRDPEQVDKYIADPWCGFVCTAEFYVELFKGLLYIHKNSQMKKVPVNLPVHFIDGTGDPVGTYSKTVKALYEIYRKNGVKNVDLVLYDDARHELLNETNKEEVIAEVLQWMDKLTA